MYDDTPPFSTAVTPQCFLRWEGLLYSYPYARVVVHVRLLYSFSPNTVLSYSCLAVAGCTPAPLLSANCVPPRSLAALFVDVCRAASKDQVVYSCTILPYTAFWNKSICLLSLPTPVRLTLKHRCLHAIVIMSNLLRMLDNTTTLA